MVIKWFCSYYFRNITNYKSIIVLIYYNSSGTEYFAEMNIPISLFKAEPIAPFYPNYHNENTFYKGRVSYVNDTHVSLTAPLLHGIQYLRYQGRCLVMNEKCRKQNLEMSVIACIQMEKSRYLDINFYNFIKKKKIF